MNYSEMIIKSQRPEGGIIPIQLNAGNFKQTDMPRNPYASGYGAKIPTSYLVKVGRRWRRVYCACFSNSGTAWINIKGRRHVVDFY